MNSSVRLHCDSNACRRLAGKSIHSSGLTHKITIEHKDYRPGNHTCPDCGYPLIPKVYRIAQTNKKKADRFY